MRRWLRSSRNAMTFHRSKKFESRDRLLLAKPFGYSRRFGMKTVVVLLCLDFPSSKRGTEGYRNPIGIELTNWEFLGSGNTRRWKRMKPASLLSLEFSESITGNRKSWKSKKSA